MVVSSDVDLSGSVDHKRVSRMRLTEVLYLATRNTQNEKWSYDLA